MSKKQGFLIILLDILLIALGIGLLIFGLLNNKKILEMLVNLFK